MIFLCILHKRQAGISFPTEISATKLAYIELLLAARARVACVFVEKAGRISNSRCLPLPSSHSRYPRIHTWITFTHLSSSRCDFVTQRVLSLSRIISIASNTFTRLTSSVLVFTPTFEKVRKKKTTRHRKVVMKERKEGISGSHISAYSGALGAGEDRA